MVEPGSLSLPVGQTSCNSASSARIVICHQNRTGRLSGRERPILRAWLNTDERDRPGNIARISSMDLSVVYQRVRMAFSELLQVVMTGLLLTGGGGMAPGVLTFFRRISAFLMDDKLRPGKCAISSRGERCLFWSSRAHSCPSHARATVWPGDARPSSRALLRMASSDLSGNRCNTF